MKALYNGYELTTRCKVLDNHRYSVTIVIKKEVENKIMSAIFDDEKMSFILEVEAQKESINLGKSVIKMGGISF